MAGYDFTSMLRTGPDLSNAWREGAEIQRAEEERQRRVLAEQQATRDAAAARQGIGEALRTGDYDRAAAVAYQYGQNDAGAGYVNIAKHGSERGEKGNEFIANIANDLLSMTYEQRREAMATMRPLLVAQGYPAAQVDAFDPTDENLTAISGYGYQREERVDHQNTAFGNETERMGETRQQQKQDFEEQNITLAPGTTLYDGRAGAVKHVSPQVVTLGEGQVATEWGSGNDNPVHPITMGDASQRMAQAFQGLGATPAFIAAALGNAHHESSWNPAKSGDGNTSHGYFQHRDPEPGNGRATTFQRVIGVHPSQATPEQTAQFVMWELTTPEGRQSAGISENEAKAILREQDPARAAMLFQRYYERPANIDPTRGATASGYFASLYGTRGNAGNRQGTPVASGPPKTDDAAQTGQQSQGAVDSLDRAIATAQRLLTHPGFGAAVGSGFDPQSWGSWNPISGETFGGTNARDFIAELEALKSQVFLPMVQQLRGMGALSNAEGLKLTEAIGALDHNMSEAAFRASVQRIITDLATYKDRSVTGGGGGNIPQGAVDMLRQNPALAPEFDRKYGAGAAARVLG